MRRGLSRVEVTPTPAAISGGPSPRWPDPLKPLQLFQSPRLVWRCASNAPGRINASTRPSASAGTPARPRRKSQAAARDLKLGTCKSAGEPNLRQPLDLSPTLIRSSRHAQPQAWRLARRVQRSARRARCRSDRLGQGQGSAERRFYLPASLPNAVSCPQGADARSRPARRRTPRCSAARSPPGHRSPRRRHSPRAGCRRRR